MRYIGNKTKLLSFIGSVIDTLRIQPGRAIDPFAGTASVAQYLKRRGYAVQSCDIMRYSYVFQRAYVQLDAVPSFATVLNDDPELRSVNRRSEFERILGSRFRAQNDLFAMASTNIDPFHRVLIYLDTYLPEMSSFVTREYSGGLDTAEDTTRLFFTSANARRIDAIRTQLNEWQARGLIDDDEFNLLLACLLEAADAVANTTGVYAAFVKSWQANATKPLRLREPGLVIDTSLRCGAHQDDANRFIRGASNIDLAYLDPPYNTRQYSSYYHIPELIAQGWFSAMPAVRGKTGLIPDADKKSRWSTRGDCVAAFRDLIANLDARHVLLSYSNEGIIPPEAVEDVFREFGQPGTFKRHALDYARYRADSDREDRVYKADRVTEYIFSCELRGAGHRARPESVATA
jgi:adenine-specific DNA-methyltransferase